MPFTQLDVARSTTRTIWVVFAALVLLYALSLLVVFALVKIYVVKQILRSAIPPLPTPTEAGIVLTAAAVAGLVHWVASTRNMFNRLLGAVGARPLDPNDTYHVRYANVVTEVSIALGGRTITPYVISTPAVNACAIADFQGHAAIAATEGALSTLSRAQLEGVVGHEAAHVASGDSVVASALCGRFALLLQLAHASPSVLDGVADQHPARPPDPEGAPALAGARGPVVCPRCSTTLEAVGREGTVVAQCPSGHGCYADETTVEKIVARGPADFSPELRQLGKETRQRLARAGGILPRDPHKIRDCPRCTAAVLRKGYSDECPVEVEQCFECGLTWFDENELELVRYLRATPDAG